VNNLYGYAMCLPVPVKNFRWLEREEINRLDFDRMTDEQEKGYIIECDLSYPDHLHKSHSSFPLAPQHLKITDDLLSPHAKGGT
jgi:hypothetical protein